MKYFTKDNAVMLLFSPIILALIVILIPLMSLAWLYNQIKGLCLNTCFRLRWSRRNKHILFVYSESPNWQIYIEENIFPIIEGEAVTINWSERSKWKRCKPLEARVMEHWGGGVDFNPMAVVFCPRGKIKVIRFHQAFKDYKHGKSSLLEKQEKKLYQCLNSSTSTNYNQEN